MYVQMLLEIEEQAVDQLSFKSVLHNTHLHIFMSICIFEYVCAGGAGSRRASSGSAEFQERATHHTRSCWQHYLPHDSGHDCSGYRVSVSVTVSVSMFMYARVSVSVSVSMFMYARVITYIYI